MSYSTWPTIRPPSPTSYYLAMPPLINPTTLDQQTELTSRRHLPIVCSSWCCLPIRGAAATMALARQPRHEIVLPGLRGSPNESME